MGVATINGGQVSNKKYPLDEVNLCCKQDKKTSLKDLTKALIGYTYFVTPGIATG